VGGVGSLQLSPTMGLGLGVPGATGKADVVVLPPTHKVDV
jgi:hypothetical protein